MSLIQILVVKAWPEDFSSLFCPPSSDMVLEGLFRPWWAGCHVPPFVSGHASHCKGISIWESPVPIHASHSQITNPVIIFPCGESFESSTPFWGTPQKHAWNDPRLAPVCIRQCRVLLSLLHAPAYMHTADCSVPVPSHILRQLKSEAKKCSQVSQMIAGSQTPVPNRGVPQGAHKQEMDQK